MSKTRSLQYLLLDTLSKRNIGKNKMDINNLAKSLRVDENNTYYEITWIEKFKKKKIEVKKDKFNFYNRGDEKNLKSKENSLVKNEKSSTEIVDNILRQKEFKNETSNFFKKYLLQIFFLSAIFLPLIFFSSIESKIIALGVFFIMFLDLIEKKKIISHLFIVVISIYNPNEIIFFYGFFLLFFTIFEPGIVFKKIKIILLTLIVVFNFYNLDGLQIPIDIHFLGILSLILLITVNNFTKYNSNFNWIYCLPSFSLIFFVNEDILISYFSLLICLIISYCFNYLDKKIFLKQTN
tara:strand:+ start:2260 stop:3141 length:882 start_codon:yes stop_codon:yes gene_type:complete